MTVAALMTKAHRSMLVGNILEKRYVVLEAIGGDGPGHRYLVYDMNGLRRLQVRVTGDDESHQVEVLDGTDQLAPSSEEPSDQPLVEAESPERRDTTQPIDLASLEEIHEPIEPRQRIRTRDIETAWFSEGEELEEKAEDEQWSADAHLHDERASELRRQATELTTDAYRRWALDLPPPVPPPPTDVAAADRVISSTAPVASTTVAGADVAPVPLAPVAPVAPVEPVDPVDPVTPAAAPRPEARRQPEASEAPEAASLGPRPALVAPAPPAPATSPVNDLPTSAPERTATRLLRQDTLQRLTSTRGRVAAVSGSIGLLAGLLLGLVLAGSDRPDGVPTAEVPRASSSSSSPDRAPVTASEATSEAAASEAAASEAAASEASTKTAETADHDGAAPSGLSSQQRRRVTALVRRAQRAARAGNWHAARRHARQALKLQPSNARAAAIRARAEARLHR